MDEEDVHFLLDRHGGIGQSRGDRVDRTGPAGPRGPGGRLRIVRGGRGLGGIGSVAGLLEHAKEAHHERCVLEAHRRPQRAAEAQG